MRHTTSKDIDTYRRQLRLSTMEAMLYETLLNTGPNIATDLALGLDCKPQAVYQLARKLADKGFITVDWQQRPRVFRAIPVEAVIPWLQEVSRDELATVQAALVSDKPLMPARLPAVGMLHGRQSLYDRYIVEANKAQSEILVYAIGIAYDEQLQAVQSEARARGVEIRHIIQQYTASNYHIIDKWQRLGIKLRHHSAPAGFHLMVFDARTVIISLSDPNNTEQRVSMVLQGRAAALAMRDYFYGLWASARLLSY